MIDLKEYSHPKPSLEGRLRRQLQKILPMCICCTLLFLFTYSSGGLSDARQRTVSKATLFPQKIWQTWKVHPLNLEEKEHSRTLSWIERNPEHRYEMLTDDNGIRYVEETYGPHGLNRPDIVYVYKSITAKIVKADMLRYLIMYAEGGLYTDVDVEAVRPISRFFPERYAESDIDMVIGIEIDQPDYREHAILGQKCMSFCQWTFMCKPGLPVMLRLVENIMSWISDQARKQGVSIADVELDFDDIIAGTGPSAFTNAILSDMSRRLGRAVTWTEFHNLAESKLIAGVLVLTVEAFAAGQGHSDSGTHDGRNVMVKHHYHASGWPSAHPRYSHPIYGEVEQCNWNFDCIRTWDTNTKTFDALPAEEKQVRLAMKKAKEDTSNQALNMAKAISLELQAKAAYEEGKAGPIAPI